MMSVYFGWMPTNVLFILFACYVLHLLGRSEARRKSNESAMLEDSDYDSEADDDAIISGLNNIIIPFCALVDFYTADFMKSSLCMFN